MDTIILREGLRERFSRFMARGRVLLLSAPCGFGKTTAAEALLAGERGVVRLRAGECGELPAPDGDWRVLLLDELQLLTAERGRAVLCDLIRTGADRRFVLLTRGAPPDYLAAFQYAGLMEVLTAEDLLFSREDTRRLLAAHGVELPDAELAELRRESVGYPLGLSFAARPCRRSGLRSDAFCLHAPRGVCLFRDRNLPPLRSARPAVFAGGGAVPAL